MSDLGMFELEDIVWDEFSESGDHIVPHPDGDLVNALVQGDLRTKLQCEIVSSGGRSTDTRKSIIKSVLSKMKEPITHSPLKEGMSQMLEKSSWSNTHDTGDTDCINTVTGLAENSKMCYNALKNGHTDSVCNKFPTDDHNLCQFQVDSEMEFFRSEQEDKECSDLFGYGWPDIGNFEDVDQMFRTCDSTFGQGNDGGADEPSWFSSSSTAADSREDTYKLGFRMKHETNSKFIPDDESLLVGDYGNKNIAYTLNSWISDADEASNTGFTNWLNGDCDNKGESASMEQALDEVSKLLPSTQVKNENTVTGKQGMDVGNMQKKQPKSQIKSGGNKRSRSSVHPSGSSAHGPQKSQLTNLKLSSTAPLHSLPSPQKQVWEPTSVNYPHRPAPHEKLAPYPYANLPATTTSKSENKNNLRPYIISTHDSNNTQPQRSDLSNPPAPRVVENVLKLQGRHQVLAQLSGGSHEQLVSRIRFPDKNLAQKQLNCIQDEVGCNSEVEERGIELLDSSTIQESSCMSSVLSNGVSLEESSLRQLQDVMDQLDVRTKLRIRDSLYRLARSAEQRHNCGNTNSCSRDGGGRTRVQITEESYECPGYIDAETDTNPIDRSIAHLLFDRPAEPSPGSTNGAFSLESHIMVPDSVSNHRVMTNQIDCNTDNKVADY